MKKNSLFLFLFALCASASALNFFGIEHNGSTADNVVNVLYGLTQGDNEIVCEYYSRLQKTDPSLAKKVDVDELTVPCSCCDGRGTLDEDRPCPECQGTGTVTDPRAIGYLHRQFVAALDAGQSEKCAWREAKTAFDERRERVPERQLLAGTVLRKEEGRAILTLPETGETVCLKGIGADFPGEGSRVRGEVWPTGSITEEGAEGEPAEIRCFTVTLWMNS